MQLIERGEACVVACGTYLPATDKLTPLFDYMIVEPLPTRLSQWVEVINHNRPLQGTVLAIGPGCYPKRYDHPEKHKRTKMWYSNRFQPTIIKPGDTVQLGGLNYGGYNFEGFYWGEKFCLACREADVVSVSSGTEYAA